MVNNTRFDCRTCLSDGAAVLGCCFVEGKDAGRGCFSGPGDGGRVVFFSVQQMGVELYVFPHGASSSSAFSMIVWCVLTSSTS